MAKLQIDGVTIAEIDDATAAEVSRALSGAFARVTSVDVSPDISIRDPGPQEDIAPVWRQPVAAGGISIAVRYSVPPKERGD